MKLIKVAVQVALVYLLFFIGELSHTFLHIPIPGSIIGMFLFFVLLFLKIIPEKWIQAGTNFLLTFMTLFFIPATVGVMNYLDLFYGKGLFLLFGIFISTCLVIFTAGIISEKLSKGTLPSKENVPEKEMRL